MHFSFPQKVLFRHCDPAGIVFFPRYAEMVNDAVEALFSEKLDWPFETMHPNNGMPTVEINLRFTAPSRHGDMLGLDMQIEKLGGSSMTLETTARCGDEVRFVARQTVVCVGDEGRPKSWPEAVRNKVARIMESEQ